jgi:tetratricopeptide (TPR) repeat protein
MGFGIHHLLDTPAMMPAIALSGLLALVLATAPAEPVPLRLAWRKIGQSTGLFLLWLILIGLGFWNSHWIRQYVAILGDIAQTEANALTADDYYQAANTLQAVVDADPRQPAYLLQQGYLYGMAASEGDSKAAELAIERYQRYLELEPTHASAWSNLAALYWQIGNQAQARAAIEQAIRFAADWPHFKRQRDIYVKILTDAETIIPPRPSLDGLNGSRFQYLREPLPEYLPQVGWGSE